MSSFLNGNKKWRGRKQVQRERKGTAREKRHSEAAWLVGRLAGRQANRLAGRQAGRQAILPRIQKMSGRLQSVAAGNVLLGGRFDCCALLRFISSRGRHCQCLVLHFAVLYRYF